MEITVTKLGNGQVEAKDANGTLTITKIGAINMIDFSINRGDYFESASPHSEEAGRYIIAIHNDEIK